MDNSTTPAVKGLDALFQTDGQFAYVDLDLIVVKKQVRSNFDDTEDNKLSELADSIKKQGVIQPILLRDDGESYELVAGERRYRAAKMAGLTNIPALIRVMTDQEAEDAQLTENIQRENLSHLDIATKLQKDLAELGSIQAVLAKHNKSESWVSKMLSLLNLPPETKKLITENISADLEVIGATKQIEKIDPDMAKKLVEDLAASKGQASARKKVAEVKDKVKPSKAKKAEAEKKAAEAVAEKNRSDEKAATSPAGESNPSGSAGSAPQDNQQALSLDAEAEKLMQRIYQDIIDGKLPGKIIDTLRKADKFTAGDYLNQYYKLGQQSPDSGKSVIDGFKQGVFEIGTFREMHLSAYMYGLSGSEFILLNVLNSVKP